MSWIANIGTISSFQGREYDVFYWKIDEFSTKSVNVAENSYYASCGFIFKGHNSWLRFYPNGVSGKSGFIGLSFLSSQLPDLESSCFRLTLGFKTRSGSIEKWFSSYIFLPEKAEFVSPALIRRSYFSKRKEELVPSDSLTFVVFLCTNKIEIIQDVEDRTETGLEKEKDNEEKSEKKGVEKVLGDIAQLLTSDDKSDATIVVEEAEFKVHSCILSARTPVFAALFEHNTLEKATRKITIADCESAIFKEFLNYIYTGSVQNLSAENSLGIYRVADKYLVKDLREVCREYIQDNLCTETFCEALQLALKCGDNELLESVIDYCAKNVKTIIRSVEWQRYIEENPREANEILIRSLGPL